MMKLPLVAVTALLIPVVFGAASVPNEPAAVDSPPTTIAAYAPPLLFAHLPEVTLQKPKTHDRWELLEEQFSEVETPRVAVLVPILHVKHTADMTIISLAGLANRLSNALELGYRHGHIRRVASMEDATQPRRRNGPFSLDDARLKFDIALANNKPYLGLRVVLPFGN